MATAQPTPAQQQPEPPDGLPDEAVLAALTILLLSDLAIEHVEAGATALLAPLGIGAQAVSAAVALAAGAVLFQPSGGPAVTTLARTGLPRRAAYLLAAARRLAAAESDGLLHTAVATERRYLGQHLNAERTRVDAAQRVDQAAVEHGPLLGWYSRRDALVTPECARAHGYNFSPLRPPSIGFPGTLHAGGCRCVPGPPHRDGKMLP